MAGLVQEPPVGFGRLPQDREVHRHGQPPRHPGPCAPAPGGGGPHRGRPRGRAQPAEHLTGLRRNRSGISRLRRIARRPRRSPVVPYPRPQPAVETCLVARADRLRDTGRPHAGVAARRDRLGQAEGPRPYQQDPARLPGVTARALPLVPPPRLPAQGPACPPAQVRYDATGQPASADAPRGRPHPCVGARRSGAAI